jgi:isoleucyl-tRNA synthetase
VKEFADDNLRFDENGRKVSKRLENTVGKGEIARYEQLLLFLQYFQKTYIGDMSLNDEIAW